MITRYTVFRVLLAIIIVSTLFSCENKKEKRIISSNSKNSSNTASNLTVFPEYGPVSVIKYNTPLGAVETVSAENRGNGFEEIAESLGFETNTDFNLTGSPKA